MHVPLNVSILKKKLQVENLNLRGWEFHLTSSQAIKPNVKVAADHAVLHIEI